MFKHSNYIDITPIIKETMAVFPGDTPFKRNVLLDMQNGSHLTLSGMTSTLHLGAHADAPSHYGRAALTMENVELTPYIGKCQVVRFAKAKGEAIDVSDVSSLVIRARRILFYTSSFPDPYLWQDSFSYFEPEALNYLAENGIILVGIDTPSVDASDSKTMDAHQVLLSKNLRVLEGLVLEKVSEGLYTLVALPLAIEGADASPVRACLFPYPFAAD